MSDKTLSEFMRQCWPLDLDYSWHLDAICDHLDAVAAGKAPRMLINVPRTILRGPRRIVVYGNQKKGG